MTHSEFSLILEKIDSQLSAEEIPVIHRPLVAATRFPSENKVLGFFPPDPRRGPYEGPNLIPSIVDWYKIFYPKQAVLPDRFQTRVMLIRGGVFRARIPFGINLFGKLNVFDHLEDFSPSLRELLSDTDRQTLQSRFNQFYVETSNILLSQQVVDSSDEPLASTLLHTGWADLKMCGDGFDAQDPASALFPALQGVEKYLKAFLACEDKAYTEQALRTKYGHNVPKLLHECSAHSSRFEQVLPSCHKLAYGPEVRYNRPPVFLSEVIDRIDLSYAICNLVASILIKRYA